MSKIAGEINHHMMRNAKTRAINAPALDLIADILEQHTAGILAGVREHMDKRKSEARSAGFDAADMATAAAQGFRDGVASVSRLTDPQIASACMSYRHDFGLLDDANKAQLVDDARSWEYAFAKEREWAAADGESNELF